MDTNNNTLNLENIFKFLSLLEENLPTEDDGGKHKFTVENNKLILAIIDYKNKLWLELTYETNEIINIEDEVNEIVKSFYNT